ncbi:hypothetical protein [Aureimonas mangrovi]|uniref:hypothetical protein n=1 Tax=Aureimonas mangrovi TaxID=2758041 RepID=UPI00163D466A|nr:hypothetical protein [Aureimonas mangrovi]
MRAPVFSRQLLALVVALAFAPAAFAAPTPGLLSSTQAEAQSEDAGEPTIELAQGNCSAAAAQAAAQSGGQVLSVSSRQQNGQTVCVVTVLIPGQDGGRPRRTTITIPG